MHAIPGDPVALRLGEHASPQEVAHLRSSLGLDRPGFVQLALYLAAVAHGDLGASTSTRTRSRRSSRNTFRDDRADAERDAVCDRGRIPAGVLAAVRHRSAIDALTMSGALLGVSIPVFWLGWILVYVFAVLPVARGTEPVPDLRAHRADVLRPARTHPRRRRRAAGRQRARRARRALAPGACRRSRLGTIPLAIIAKITRSGMLDVAIGRLHPDRTCQRVGAARPCFKHALRNALIPIITSSDCRPDCCWAAPC